MTRMLKDADHTRRQPHFASEQSSDGALRLAPRRLFRQRLTRNPGKPVGVRPRPAASFSSVFPVFLRRWP